MLTQAVRRDGKNPANYLPLGVVYAAKRKPKQAIENYELFLKYAPKNDPDRAACTQCDQRVEALDSAIVDKSSAAGIDMYPLWRTA